ncbi:Protein disulfide-isomerase [Gryllus bimaculatus]|nr:Protein disulfide-isomerase [Gryllus bimaculatus]
MSMGMKVTGEERDVDGENHSTQETTVACKMYFYGREFCFVLALLFTSYAALQNAPPKVSKSPLPVRFFSRTSLVADFYYGQLSSAFERVAESDVSFVMYYAPWDAESQSLKEEFAIVAQYYYKQVYFAAINCWQPLGECRQQFSKIQHFPVLIAYTQHTKGIQYKGVKEAGHMIKFIQSVVRPLSRIEHPHDLVDLMASHDAVVVGLFHFSGNIGSPGFHTFYSTSLKFLERDPLREVGFGVVTNEVAAAHFGIFELPAVRLYMWNETLEYSQSADYSVDALTKWMSHNVHQVSVWVSPPGVKSLTLSPYVEKGSVLMLFTPRNPFLIYNQFYDMVREIGLEYYNCDDNPWVQDLSSQITRKQNEYLQEQKHLDSYCDLMKRYSRYGSDKKHASNDHWCSNENSTYCPDRCYLDSGSAWFLAPGIDQSLDYVPFSKGSGCAETNDKFSCKKWQSGHCMYEEELSRSENQTDYGSVGLETSMLKGLNDERAATALLLAAAKERCQQWDRAQRVHTALPRYVSIGQTPPGFRGLACRSNQSLSLLAMDTLQFHQFAEGLGLDVLSFPDKTAVVIFNAELESTYVLNGPVSHSSLLDFMTNYTKGLLSRSLRNSSQQWSTSLNKYREIKSESCTNSESEMCIQELTSSNFEAFVMAEDKDVVLLYHSPYCAFCHSVSHIYLTVARYFRLHHSLEFYRIDGENNDLPWEFTMDRYPTLLFFPAFRKSDSRVYPSNLPLTVSNLINFVLANLRGLSHMEGILALCSGWDEGVDNVSAKDCVDQVRGETVELIADTLSRYRKSVFRQSMQSVAINASSEYQRLLRRQTKDLLFQLHTLREINLLLGSVSRLQETSSEYLSIQKSLEMYYKHSYVHHKSNVTFQSSQHTKSEDIKNTNEGNL